MPRYFIEVSYNGARYSGLQVQRNARTIQSALEEALEVCFRKEFSLTGASRTDAGVHALQNYFHFDCDEELMPEANDGRNNAGNRPKQLYSLNSLLPWDIVVRNIIKVKNDAHSRFDATSREYQYRIYQSKDPFLRDRAFFYPYRIDVNQLKEAAAIILNANDFTSFSKRNTQVNNFTCSLKQSEWACSNELLVYNVKGNRFLRGMVRGLVGTMLRVGSGKISVSKFKEIIESKDCGNADFSVPPQGLFLISVNYTFI
ncbi:MAG: tRNA pseudouridine(38-40) synthase TruA [Ginsengibacter sp.]